ncbi:MAG: hypothetical protein JXR95_05735 [Deltaproteobacteria bacterium]|nr:hypothetical protein [Deltaproteobacteria bacterium]
MTDTEEKDPRENLPPPVVRRRKINRYYTNQDSHTFDWVVIMVALLIGTAMIYTKGCNSSIQNLAKLMTQHDKNNNPDAATIESQDAQ